MKNVGLGYLSAVFVTSFVLVGLSVLMNLAHPVSDGWGPTAATGGTLIVMAVGLAIFIACYMIFIVLVPFIAIYWIARWTGLRSRFYYSAMGSFVGVLLGGFTPMGLHGFLAGPIAGAAGGWTFWQLSVRDPDAQNP